MLHLAALGYFIECIRRGACSRHSLPDWNHWGQYFQEGLMAFLIIAVYLLIPVVAAAFGTDIRTVVILIAIFGIMIPMALARYAISGAFSQAFNLGELFPNIGRVANYYLLSYLAVALVNGLAALILLWLPVLAFIGTFLIFYSGVVYLNYAGRLYHRATAE